MGRRMTPQALAADFDAARAEERIFIRCQPQYNHATGQMIGAEALMRWQHPEHGPQTPADFIPALEKNGLIHEADLHVFRLVCAFQRRCLDEGIPALPISFNISRHDFFKRDYAAELEAIREEYGVPVSLLRAEITESAAVGGAAALADFIRQLHARGYFVEMDDFGSGYSSLNALKDLAFDAIKLDMHFLSSDINGRGGTILSAVVQMAKWLGTPVIAEGVETHEQADFMRSIGCNYVQGYLYARPMSEDKLIEKLREGRIEPMRPPMQLSVNAVNFWKPDSFETLIFSQYVGAAAVFSFRNGVVEILRVNHKYVAELGVNVTEADIVRASPWQYHTEDSKRIYEETIRRAIQSGQEEVCDTWRHFHSACCGDDAVCIRSHIQVIGQSGEQLIIYARIQNVTSEKKHYEALFESERRFRFASEQANVYAWEYDIASRQMRPCFRCMRDLNLPPLVENYPEPAINAGIFPPDYADMYRDWHRQLAAGADHLEAVIPLTVGRVPFHVRYTTEFDSEGRPVKAYGSATLVVDEKSAQDAPSESNH